MRLFFTIVILFLCGGAFTQKIPLDTLLSFYYKNVSVAENYLQSSGYEFRNRQTHPGFKSVTIYWDYKVEDAEHFAQLDVDTVKNITTRIGYSFYGKEEFIELMSVIKKLRFNDTKPLMYREDGTDKEFIRDDVNILLSTTKYDYDKVHYRLAICNCTFSR
jgi:hypothetical protein